MIEYSNEAHKWFNALGRHRDVVKGVDTPSAASWIRLSVKDQAETYTIPLMHGLEEATMCSLQYVLTLPKIWERLGVREMTVLQALEVKNRALIMGDLAAAFRKLTDAELLPKKFEGVIKVRNPYNYMSLLLAQRIEAIDKDVPRVAARAPKKWSSPDCIDEYDVRAFVCNERGHGIGLAILNDIPDVSPFDIAGSMVLGNVG